MVKVVMTGDLELKSLEIDPDAVDPEDVEMLQDMVMAAVNEALRQAMELQGKAAGTGGLDPAAALDALGGLGRSRRTGRRARRRWSGWCGRAPRRSAQPGRPAQAEVAPARPSRTAPGHRAGQAPWHRQPARRNGLAFHVLSASPRTRTRSADAIRDVQGADLAVRGLLQPRPRAPLHDLPGRAALIPR
jgi:hypothetical protein